MAIGTPTERYAKSLNTQGASSGFKPDTTVAAGTFAILVITTSVDGKIVNSISDNTGGNTWAIDLTFNAVSANYNISICSCQVATQITGGGSGNTITAGYAVTTNNQAHIWVQEVTGIATSSAFDKSASGQGTGQTITTSASATLSQADEFVIVGVRGSDLTGWTKGATYSDPTTVTLGAPLSALEWKIVSATTAVTGNGTQTATAPADWAIALATYKGAATGNTYTKAGFATENRVA